MGKTVISQLPLWHDHIYLLIEYIQFCCPKFTMKQMKEIISHGVHGSQHFLCDNCPIALFPLFPPHKCFVFSASPAFFYMCAAVVSPSLCPTFLHTQLLPDHWIFIHTHLCTNSLSALHVLYALTVPRAAQWIRNLEQFFTSLNEEY